MRDMPPCKPMGTPCTRRKPGCQDHCPDFAKWKKKENERAERRNKEKEKMEISYSPRAHGAMIRKIKEGR